MGSFQQSENNVVCIIKIGVNGRVLPVSRKSILREIVCAEA